MQKEMADGWMGKFLQYFLIDEKFRLSDLLMLHFVFHLFIWKINEVFAPYWYRQAIKFASSLRSSFHLNHRTMIREEKWVFFWVEFFKSAKKQVVSNF